MENTMRSGLQSGSIIREILASLFMSKSDKDSAKKSDC